MHVFDCDPAGFEWIDANDGDNSVLSLLRKSRDPKDTLVVACNFTPVPRHNYQVGVPWGGRWDEVLNSDAPMYGGSGQGNFGGVTAAPVGRQGRPYLIPVTVPPLGMWCSSPRASGLGEIPQTHGRSGNQQPGTRMTRMTRIDTDQTRSDLNLSDP